MSPYPPRAFGAILDVMRVPIVTRVLPLLVLAATPTAYAQIRWTQLSPAAVPPARGAPAMAYDPDHAKIVLFGGFPAAGYLADTWILEGHVWREIHPPVSPPARAAAGFAWDAATHKLVLFGGYDGVHDLGDTWIFDGATETWTDAHPPASPTAVTGPSLFTDPLLGRVDAFGGFNGMFYQLTTWQWDGATWQQLHPTHSPSARAAAIAALDPVHGSVVLFGGLGSVNPNNTWLWDGTDWISQSPGVQIPLRYNSSAVFDERLQRVVVFGGGSGGAPLNDTWIWTGSTWRQLFPSQAPTGRESFGLAYDRALRHTIVFGGDRSGNLLNDMWWLDLRP